LVISISINGLCKADAKCNEPLFAKLQGDLGRVVAEIGQYTIACCSAETNLEKLMKLEQLGEGVIPEFAHTVDRVANGGIPVGDLLVNPLGVYLIPGG